MKRTALRRNPARPLRRRTPLTAVPILSRKAGTRTKASPAPRKAPRNTGFSPEVKLLIRTRAGNGDPENACCEACAMSLGEDGGQIQHIYARQIGGSKRWLYRSAANGALLCGTPESGDHGLCEARDAHMYEMGFWRKRNGREKPGDYPIMLHGGGGVWLTPGGGYAFTAPGGIAA